MILVTGFTEVFTSLGNSIFGSTAMFSVVVVILFAILMIMLNIPSTFVLSATALLTAGLFYMIDNTGFIRVLFSIFGLVIGVIIALFILGVFYNRQY